MKMPPRSLLLLLLFFLLFFFYISLSEEKISIRTLRLIDPLLRRSIERVLSLTDDGSV